MEEAQKAEKVKHVINTPPKDKKRKMNENSPNMNRKGIEGLFKFKAKLIIYPRAFVYP